MTITVSVIAVVVVEHPDAGTMRSSVHRQFIYENVSPFMPGVDEHGKQIAVPIPDLRPSTFSPDIADAPGLCRRIFAGEAHWALLDIERATFLVQCRVSVPPGQTLLTAWPSDSSRTITGKELKYGLPDFAEKIANGFDSHLSKIFLLWASLRLPEVPG